MKLYLLTPTQQARFRVTGCDEAADVPDAIAEELLAQEIARRVAEPKPDAKPQPKPDTEPEPKPDTEPEVATAPEPAEQAVTRKGKARRR